LKEDSESKLRDLQRKLQEASSAGGAGTGGSTTQQQQQLSKLQHDNKYLHNAVKLAEGQRETLQAKVCLALSQQSPRLRRYNPIVVLMLVLLAGDRAGAKA
jgi:hypothetical protein